MAKKRTKKEQDKMKVLVKENESLRWFCVTKPFEVFNTTLKVGWYELTRTYLDKSGHWIHQAKLRGSDINLRVTDSELMSIVNMSKDKNEHILNWRSRH